MITDRKTANGMSGKTARPCDGCSSKRARWFCAADDAFLCKSCDVSVHSANQLASRHERVRLETSSFKVTGPNNPVDSAPVWHQGFTRKARTPRNNGNKSLRVHDHQLKDEENALTMNPVLPLVPEIGSEEEGMIALAVHDDDQLLCRVPVFDPFAAELFNDDIVTSSEGAEIALKNEERNTISDGYNGQDSGKCDDLGILPEFLSSDMDLAEFAADVENLLGLDEDSPDINEFNLLDCKEEEVVEDDDQKFCSDDKNKAAVKVKREEVRDHSDEVFYGIAGESLKWSFNDESPTITENEIEEEKGVAVDINSEEKKEKRNEYLLRLNYEAVINAWACQGSPWTSGSRPDINPDRCLPDCMGTCNKNGHHHAFMCIGGQTEAGNRAREARVLRYKEKRRSRLFSKKIRYEVRKLNADKRPRLKGRFVKRTSFVGNAFSYI